MSRINLKSTARYIILALITSTVFLMAPEHIESQNYAFERALWNILGAFYYNSSPLDSLLIPAIAVFYAYSDSFLKDKLTLSVWSEIVPAFIFAFLTLLGISFSQVESWSMVFSLADGQIIKAAILIAGYSLLFYYLIRWFYYFLSKPCAPASESSNWYMRCLNKHTYITVCCSLLIVYVPLLILSYPGIPIGDVQFQLTQAYPELDIDSWGFFYLQPWANVWNTHHPILHSLLLYACVELGRVLFHSGNYGLLLMSLCQLAISLLAISYAIDVMLHRFKLRSGFAVLCLVYYALHPMVQNYMFFITKDIIYSASFMAFLISFYLVLKGRHTPPDLVVLVISCLGFLTFRNEGRYVLLFSLLIIAILVKSHRKKASVLLVSAAAFCVLFFNIALPALGVVSGSIREMLSVPFQQTARYISECPDEVTEDERLAIDTVLDYDTISQVYNPSISDPVKGNFREEATTQDLLNYFKVWAEMFFKHPSIYIQATLNNYYQYFAFGSYAFYDFSFAGSSQNLYELSVLFAPYDISFGHIASFEYAQSEYEYFRDIFSMLPLISLLMVPACYTWPVILMFIHGLVKKHRASLLVSLIPLVAILIVMLGPCNGSYGRYLYPIVFSMPFIIALYKTEINDSI